MPSHDANSRTPALSRSQLLRQAVLRVFCEPLPPECSRLRAIAPGDWPGLLRWLDTSGLALYFYDRLQQLGLLDLLPAAVHARLQHDLAQNSLRFEGMLAETAALQRRFKQAGVSYAVLKGFSLWPRSVPRLELRSQLDLDFLVAQDSAPEARRILIDAGYALKAVSGRTWEFTAIDGRSSSLRDLYRPGLNRSVELHLEPPLSPNSLLARAQTACVHGLTMPVLAPADLFTGQGLHVYKHLASEFMRAAHLIEFRRHVLARRGDLAFWRSLEHQLAGDPAAALRLGTALQFIAHATAPFVPAALSRFTVDRLPLTTALWIERYGHLSALAAFPGTKLYLLLEQEQRADGIPARRSLRAALVPRRLPPALISGVPGETLAARIPRLRRQLHFILFRLRFHMLEGLRFLCESIRWRQFKAELSQ